MAAAACFTLYAASNQQGQAVEAFYRKVSALKLSGLPNAEQAASLAPYVSAALRAAIFSAQQEQSRCTKANPGDVPPWVDGDLFTSNTEGFTALKTGAADAQGRITPRFTYVESGRGPRGGAAEAVERPVWQEEGSAGRMWRCRAGEAIWAFARRGPRRKRRAREWRVRG